MRPCHHDETHIDHFGTRRRNDRAVPVAACRLDAARRIGKGHLWHVARADQEVAGLGACAPQDVYGAVGECGSDHGRTGCRELAHAARAGQPADDLLIGKVGGARRVVGAHQAPRLGRTGHEVVVPQAVHGHAVHALGQCQRGRLYDKIGLLFQRYLEGRPDAGGRVTARAGIELAQPHVLVLQAIGTQDAFVGRDDVAHAVGGEIDVQADAVEIPVVRAGVPIPVERIQQARQIRLAVGVHIVPPGQPGELHMRARIDRLDRAVGRTQDIRIVSHLTLEFDDALARADIRLVPDDPVTDATRCIGFYQPADERAEQVGRVVVCKFDAKRYAGGRL
jgi:hypothetical protein